MSKTLLLCLASAIVGSTFTFLAMQERPIAKTEGDFYVVGQPAKCVDAKAPQPYIYNPAYQLLGWSAPSSSGRSVYPVVSCPDKPSKLQEIVSLIRPPKEVVCTYLPPGSIHRLNNPLWQRVEATYFEGEIIALDFRAEPQPTAQEVAKCDTEADFRKRTLGKRFSFGTFLPETN